MFVIHHGEEKMLHLIFFCLGKNTFIYYVYLYLDNC